MMILTMNLTLQSYWLCMSLLKTLKDSDCSIICLYFTIASYWLYLPCEIYYVWEFLLLDSCDYWIEFTCLRMYGVILVTLVWVCCVNVSMIDYLCWYNCICCVGRGLQHSICALPNPFSCKWNKICLNQEIVQGETCLGDWDSFLWCHLESV